MDFWNDLASYTVFSSIKFNLKYIVCYFHQSNQTIEKITNVIVLVNNFHYFDYHRKVDLHISYLNGHSVYCVANCFLVTCNTKRYN